MCSYGAKKAPRSGSAAHFDGVWKATSVESRESPTVARRAVSGRVGRTTRWAATRWQSPALTDLERLRHLEPLKMGSKMKESALAPSFSVMFPLTFQKKARLRARLINNAGNAPLSLKPEQIGHEHVPGA